MHINPCKECGSCDDGQGCSQDDDMVLIMQKMDEADAIVFGSPVYYYGVSAQAKTIIDRCLARSKGSATKFGAMVVTARSMGISSAIKDLLMFFAVQGLIPVEAIASYVPFAQDGASMQRAFSLGKELANIIHKKYRLPGLRMTGYAFGTHTK
jgi:multimeric flavodoxin WrbA